MKTFSLDAWGKTHTILLDVEKYTNDRLAIEMLEKVEGDFIESWSMLTVNVPTEELSDENCAFINTNNNGNDIVFWLMENGLGSPTARWAHSGFCDYPEFRFNMEMLVE